MKSRQNTDEFELVDLDKQQREAAGPARPSDEDPFLVGVALSVYQNAGGEGTNWSAFEKEKWAFGRTPIEGGDVVGDSTGFWDNYEADIARVAALNSNCFRFSMEWGRIEPAKGELHGDSIAKYHAILDCCKKHGLEPMVTLHHFVHPLWFDALSGFENAENIGHFVDYAVACVKEFGQKARLWATFNEINVMGFCGYLYGQFPPAHLLRFTTAGRHMLNMLRSHTQAYKAIKALPGGASVRVGIIHNFLRYQPLAQMAPSATYVQPLCDGMEHIWGTAILLRYFQTGRYHWKVPLQSDIVFQEDTVPGLDFVGMNYYSRVLLDWKLQPSCPPGDRMTQMPFPLYAPGLYEGIAALSELGVPMYITETGCADSRDEVRPEMIRTYMAQLERAVHDGYDVCGVFHWTLIDNWEWAHGFHRQFGLFQWSPGDGKNRTKRPSADVLASIYQTFPAVIAQARAEGNKLRMGGSRASSRADLETQNLLPN